MRLVCPECKNDVDLTAYPDLAEGNAIECDSCGISLQVKNLENDEIDAEVIDEGK